MGTSFSHSINNQVCLDGCAQQVLSHFPPIMPVKHPFNIYREQLWPLYHGFALWKPNPVEGNYNHVSIGDVGYIYEGGFIRMFNVTLPWDDESNKTLGEPCHYDRLSSDSFAIRRETFGKVDYYSRRVLREETVGNTQAASPDE